MKCSLFKMTTCLLAVFRKPSVTKLGTRKLSVHDDKKGQFKKNKRQLSTFFLSVDVNMAVQKIPKSNPRASQQINKGTIILQANTLF